MTKVPNRPVADIVILIHFTGYSMTVDYMCVGMGTSI